MSVINGIVTTVNGEMCINGSIKTNKKLGVLICGLGRAGIIHFNNVMRSSRCRLEAVVEARQEFAAETINEWFESDSTSPPIIYKPEEIDKALLSKSLDVVIVASPTKTHRDIVVKCLQSGKSVFCEKPISESSEETAMCYQIADQRGKHLLCAFNRRFDPSVTNLYNRVYCASEIGNIHVIKTCSRDSPLPPITFLQSSGGIFHDCAVHDIDIICWMLGEKPTTVYANAHCHNKQIKQINDVDTVVIVMKFPSGALSVTDLSRDSTYGYDQRIEVFGSCGMLSVQNVNGNNVVSSCNTGVNQSTYKHSFPQRYYDAYVLELEHFCDAVQGRVEKLTITKDNTLSISKIASACEESFNTGREVILKW